MVGLMLILIILMSVATMWVILCFIGGIIYLCMPKFKILETEEGKFRAVKKTFTDKWLLPSAVYTDINVLGKKLFNTADDAQCLIKSYTDRPREKTVWRSW